MEKTGADFGLFFDRDVFAVMSFGFHERYEITGQEMESLHQVGAAVASCVQPANPGFDPVIRFKTQVSVVLSARSEEEMKSLLLQVEPIALGKTEEYFSDRPVRIGEGSIGRGLEGLQSSYDQSVRAIKAGAIFKADKKLLRYSNMEIYSILDEIMRTHGQRLSSTVLGCLSPREQQVLAAYYECKEDAGRTAECLGMTEAAVCGFLEQVKKDTGLDVDDSEDSFKLHLVMLTDKVQKYVAERES